MDDLAGVNFISGMNSYANMEWDYELFTKSMETIEKYSNKY